MPLYPKNATPKQPLLSLTLHPNYNPNRKQGFNLPATSVAQLNWVEDVTVKTYAVGYQYMMFFNTTPRH